MTGVDILVLIRIVRETARHRLSEKERLRQSLEITESDGERSISPSATSVSDAINITPTNDMDLTIRSSLRMPSSHPTSHPLINLLLPIPVPVSLTLFRRNTAGLARPRSPN